MITEQKSLFSYSFELENNIKEFIINEIINSSSKGTKAIDDMVRNLWPMFVKYQINFNNFLIDYHSDEIIDVSFLDNPGVYKWVNFISPKYREFAKELSRLRPIGLGTPNAAPGEAEFMILILSKKAKKPSKGDIQINNSLKEFKDENPRVQSKKVHGKEFRIKTVELAKKYGLKPNTNRTNYTAVELTEIDSRKTHWDTQLSKLTIDMRINFLSDWLVLTGTFSQDESRKSAKIIFIDGVIDRNKLQIELCKFFFKNQLPDTPGDNLLMFKDDLVFNVKYDINSYNKMFDDKLLIPTGNYIRINQTFPIAWYYSFNKDKINEYTDI
jgi:hypothetical protein